MSQTSPEKYILKKAEIEADPGLSKTHFLNPNAQRNNKSLGDMTGLSGFGFHLIEIEPGKESTEFHVHHHEDECVYVLAGKATVTIGDVDTEVSEGDFVGYRAGGEAHTMRNTSDTTLRCIVVGQRLDHDVGDYPRQKKRIYRNAGRPWDLVDHAQIVNPKGGRKI